MKTKVFSLLALSSLSLMLTVSLARAQTYDYGTPAAPSTPSAPATQSAPGSQMPSDQSQSVTPTTIEDLNSPNVPSTGAGGMAATNLALIAAAFLIVAGVVQNSREQN